MDSYCQSETGVFFKDSSECDCNCAYGRIHSSTLEESTIAASVHALSELVLTSSKFMTQVSGVYLLIYPSYLWTVREKLVEKFTIVSSCPPRPPLIAITAPNKNFISVRGCQRPRDNRRTPDKNILSTDYQLKLKLQLDHWSWCTVRDSHKCSAAGFSPGPQFRKVLSTFADNICSAEISSPYYTCK